MVKTTRIDITGVRKDILYIDSKVNIILNCTANYYDMPFIFIFLIF